MHNMHFSCLMLGLGSFATRLEGLEVFKLDLELGGELVRFLISCLGFIRL